MVGVKKALDCLRIQLVTKVHKDLEFLVSSWSMESHKFIAVWEEFGPKLRILVFNFEDLRIDLMVHRFAFISIEKENKNRFSRTYIPPPLHEGNVNKHPFVHEITTVHGFLMGSSHVNSYALVRVSLGAMELSKRELSFGIEKLGVELGDKVRHSRVLRLVSG